MSMFENDLTRICNDAYEEKTWTFRKLMEAHYISGKSIYPHPHGDYEIQMIPLISSLHICLLQNGKTIKNFKLSRHELAYLDPHRFVALLGIPSTDNGSIKQ